MVGEIVDTLKGIAGRWLMRSARTATEHPFDAPKHYDHLSASQLHPSEEPPAAVPEPPVAAPPAAPVAAAAHPPAPMPEASTAEPGATAPTSPSRAWTAEMREASPTPGGEIGDKIVGILRTCYDPEIPVNIYELGLIYGIEVDDDQKAWVVMTLTSPMCPVAGSLPPEVESKVASVEGIKSAKVDVVWEPPWNPDMMSEAAKLDLGML